MSKYTVGEISFNTKGAAKEHAKNVLNKKHFGSILNDEDTTFILDLFYMRESNRKKVTRNSVKFVYTRDNGKGSMEFVISSKYNGEICFSYLKCFNDKSPRSKFTSACRNAIVSNKPYCPDGYERHHAGKSMAKIIDMFIAENSIDISGVEYTKADFADMDLRTSFYEFHDKHAEWLIVTPEEHLAIHSGIN